MNNIASRLFGLFKKPLPQPEKPVEKKEELKKGPEVRKVSKPVQPAQRKPSRPRPKQSSKQKEKKSFQQEQIFAERKKLAELVDEFKRREKEFDKRVEVFDEKERHLRNKENRLDSLEIEVEKKKESLLKKQKDLEKQLEETAGLNKDQAKEELKKRTEKELVAWIAKRLEEAKDSLEAQKEEIAKEVLVEAVRHGTVDWVAEYTMSVIKLKDEDIKGKVIGREGRNIRAFEKATGVELELDESNEIRLSSFDPIRREIAKIALSKLIKDGRIQPSRIEDVVKQTKSQMDKVLIEEGKKICQAVGVYHLPIDLVRKIGRFKYRFSHGQNLAQHTIEVTKIGVALAHELKADVKIVRLAGLLHDIGKIVYDREGSHIDLGVEVLKRFNLPEKVINAVAEHHEDRPFSSVESTIIWIADAASGSRPGARYEAHEEYLKRMTNIEEIVNSFEGIDEVAAYQAGREVRVIVQPEKVSEDEVEVLVYKIAEKLNEEAKWAGQIKITAIRETRASAKAPTVDNDQRSG